MRILFTNGNEGHVSREVGEALILGGMATEIPNETDTKLPPPAPLTFRLSESSLTGEPTLTWSGSAPGQIMNGGAFWPDARNTKVWFQGKCHVPPPELLAEMKRRVALHHPRLSVGQRISEGDNPFAGSQDRDITFTQQPYPLRDPMPLPGTINQILE